MATATGPAFAPDPPRGQPVRIVPDSQGIVRVKPGQLRLAAGSSQLDTVTWVNNTNDPVTLEIKDRAAEFFDALPPDPIVIPAGRTQVLKVAKSLTPGIHKYQVKLMGGGTAEGNSDPTVSCP